MSNENEQEKMSLSLESLLKILDYSSDEIYVLDKEIRIVYVNRNCEKHYGMTKDDVVGKYNDDFFNDGYWTPSVVPLVLEKKTPVSVRQQTHIGAELLTRAFPILNSNNEIEYIVCTATEIQDFKRLVKKEEPNLTNSTDEVFTSTIITNNAKMRKILRFCEKVAPTDSTILIHG